MATQWILGLLGAFAVIAFIATTLQARPYKDGATAEGTVVGIDTRSERSAGQATRRSTTYAPTVEFADSAGIRHTVTRSLSGGVRPGIGSTVLVSYRPDDPSQARILGDRHTRVGRYLFLVVGLALIAGAIVLSLN